MNKETEEKFIMKIGGIFKIPDKGIVLGGGNPEITLEDTSRLCRKGEMIRIKNENRELRLKAEDIRLSTSIAGAVIIGILVRESDEASELCIGDRVYEE